MPRNERPRDEKWTASKTGVADENHVVTLLGSVVGSDGHAAVSPELMLLESLEINVGMDDRGSSRAGVPGRFLRTENLDDWFALNKSWGNLFFKKKLFGSCRRSQSTHCSSPAACLVSAPA
jgi:hypothetical protein